MLDLAVAFVAGFFAALACIALAVFLAAGFQVWRDNRKTPS